MKFGLNKANLATLRHIKKKTHLTKIIDASHRSIKLHCL